MSARRIRRLKIAWFPAQKSLQVICNRNLAHSFSPASLKIFIFWAGSSNFKVFDFCFLGFLACHPSLEECSIQANSSLGLSEHLACLLGFLELNSSKIFNARQFLAGISFGEFYFQNSLNDVPGRLQWKAFVVWNLAFWVQLLSFFRLPTFSKLKLYKKF